MKNVLDYLEKSVNLYRNKCAVIEEEKKITYEELLKRSKAVGTKIANNFENNEPIIIFMDKGIDTLVAFFGSIYAGCFYSLINPLFPISRIRQISEVLNAKCVITNKENIDYAKECFENLLILDIEEISNTLINEDILSERRKIQVDYDPLYVNFTSGSTGVPKGVVISHRSVIDFINNFTNIFKFENDDIIANQAPFDFDVSVKDIYSSLCVGATLLIVPKKYFSNPTMLLDYIVDNNTTTLIWAVSALCLITTFHGLDYKVPTTINKVLFSGEVMPTKHLYDWINHLPDATFVNLYGPTEITCNATYHIIDKNRDYSDKIPIGISFPNERVFLLNENDKLITESNIKGEICVAGTALALGYYNNKEQTDLHFLQNPLINNYKELIYKTGDLGIYNKNNELIFMGRKDFQIKYLGHRIELEEIEKVVMEQELVNRCVCLFDEEKSRLYAFYIGDISNRDLHIKLRESLPIYMIPTKLIKVEEFPITKNGKVDRKLLMNEVYQK